MFFYDIFLDDNKYIFIGEFEWFCFLFFYWGIGFNILNEVEELFIIEIGNVNIIYYCLLKNYLYVGGILNWSKSLIMEKDLEGLLVDDGLVLGNNGGKFVGLGVGFRYDRRDNYFNVLIGFFLEVSIIYNC